MNGFKSVVSENPLCTNEKSKAYVGNRLCQDQTKILGKFGIINNERKPKVERVKIIFFLFNWNNSLKMIYKINWINKNRWIKNELNNAI